MKFSIELNEFNSDSIRLLAMLPEPENCFDDLKTDEEQSGRGPKPRSIGSVRPNNNEQPTIPFSAGIQIEGRRPFTNRVIAVIGTDLSR